MNLLNPFMVLSTRNRTFIGIEELLNNKLDYYAIVDVRSPSEYLYDHIPTSINIPILNDQERTIVGTIYKTDGPFKAKLKALNLIHMRLPETLENIIEISKNKPELIIYCARGGARSEVVQTLLRLLQVNSLKLLNGYKAYRKTIYNFFDHPIPTQCITLYGLTGCGKTLILKNLLDAGYPSVNLEHCASHKGSNFGHIGEENFNDITQKKLESALWYSLYKQNYPKVIFVEGESKKIGKVVLPKNFCSNMINGIKIYMELPLKNRISFIINEYKPHIYKNEIITAFKSIERYIGKSKSATLLKLLIDNRFYEFTELILKIYYDPLYTHSFPAHFDYTIKYDTLDEAEEKIKKIYYEVIK
jgi:tRNA 2-selenouridine synthase